MAKPVIAIDGPAASGKGTLARRLAKELNFDYLDTGKLYRSVGLLTMDGNNLTDANILATITDDRITSDEAGSKASEMAAKPKIRQMLLDIQKNAAQNVSDAYDGIILDGRDIGTVICPDADVKFFIHADVEVRARRRFDELSQKPLQSGEKPITYDAVLADMRVRDDRDASRNSAPMKPADDAVVIDTTNLDASEAFETVLEITRKKLGHI